MRVTSLAGSSVLSFNQFNLPLTSKRTIVVGPNGAGKSNIARLITICHRAVECGDGARGDVERMLASFRSARHVGSNSPDIEARVGIRLTDEAERGLVVEFVRAMVTGAITSRRTVQNMTAIDAWAAAEITESKLSPLMEGEIVANHPGTEEGGWQCAYEFNATGHGGSLQRYRWILLGDQADAVLTADSPLTFQGSDISTRITGNSAPQSGPEIEIPVGFQLLSLLPHPDLSTMSCAFDLTPRPSASQRRLAQMTGLSLATSGRRVSLATVLRLLLGRALVQTSDTRLLPAGGQSWSSADLTLTSRAEARLPELLLKLKNGDPTQRVRYNDIQDRFSEFTQGRACEVRLMPGLPQPTEPGQEEGPPPDMPTVWVTVDVVADQTALIPEVPVQFAGAGAWEALVLASVLTERTASVVVLDEAVALHPTLQRQLGAHLQTAAAQFLVITHSAELLPLGPATDVQIVRLDRDDCSATKPWPLSEDCRLRMSRKLVAKGNERLPFAWRCIMCEGETDVEAVIDLAERMGIDLRRRNVAVADCGSRDNLPDYIWFCAGLGLQYLAVMDADGSNPAAAPKAQAVRAAIVNHGGGELIEFPEDLEKTFGVAKQKRSLVPAAIGALPFAGMDPDPSNTPDEIVHLAAAIRRLTGTSQPNWPQALRSPG